MAAAVPSCSYIIKKKHGHAKRSSKKTLKSYYYFDRGAGTANYYKIKLETFSVGVGRVGIYFLDFVYFPLNRIRH